MDQRPAEFVDLDNLDQYLRNPRGVEVNARGTKAICAYPVL
jgi:hypothetical protein